MIPRVACVKLTRMPDHMHSAVDTASLALAERIATQLASTPAWIVHARRTLAAWQARHADSPSLRRCYAEWETLLQRPPHEVGAALTERSERGAVLRQNSPFAGVLPDEVRSDVLSAFRDHDRRAPA